MPRILLLRNRDISRIDRGMGIPDMGQFLTLVSAYCAAADVAEATVSTKLFDDGKRIARLRENGDLGARKLQTAVKWLSDNWPGDAHWPSDIPRPVAETAGAAS